MFVSSTNHVIMCWALFSLEFCNFLEALCEIMKGFLVGLFCLTWVYCGSIHNVKTVDGFYLKLHFFTSILSMTDKLRYLPLVSWHIISPEPTRSCSLFTITFPRTWYGWFFNRKTQWYVDLPQLYKAAWLLYLSATSRLESLHNCWMLLRNIPNLTLPSLQEEGKKIIHLCTYLKWSWIILCSF